VAELSFRLAAYDVDDIDVTLVPHLAAAASELAFTTGTAWTVSADDPVVVLLRVIAKVNLRHPTATGPFTARLFDRLAPTRR
jgi:hypothetical protein